MIAMVTLFKKGDSFLFINAQLCIVVGDMFI
jgi:hypothetical protein